MSESSCFGWDSDSDRGGDCDGFEGFRFYEDFDELEEETAKLLVFILNICSLVALGLSRGWSSIFSRNLEDSPLPLSFSVSVCTFLYMEF